RTAGAPFPAAPFPLLFADRATVTEHPGARAFLSWTLSSCGSAGAADPLRITLRAPCPAGDIAPELDGLEALPAALVPILEKLILLGIVIAGGAFAVKFVEALQGIPERELELAMRRVEGERDGERAAAANRCATQ